MKKWLLIGTALSFVLLLHLVPAEAATLTFNQGVDLWLSSSNTPDTGNPNLGWGRNVGANPRNYDSLIKFTDMFGTNPDQIPLGSTINNASMHLYMTDRVGNNSYIYQMTIDWDETATWNSIGGGIIPGVNTEAEPEVAWVGANPAWHWGVFDLTQSVQDWSQGAANNGWGLTADRYYVFTACSFEYSSDPSLRPYLTVDFTPVPVPATMLLMGSGIVGLAGFRRRLKKQ